MKEESFCTLNSREITVELGTGLIPAENCDLLFIKLSVESNAVCEKDIAA